MKTDANDFRRNTMTVSAIHPQARRHAARSILLSLALVFAPLAAIPTANAGTPVSVDIKKFAFAPKEITVAVGTTITWTNHDETPHILLAQDKSFASKAMDTDDHFSFTFTRPGDYSYFCTMHPFMTGIVHVSKK